MTSRPLSPHPASSRRLARYLTPPLAVLALVAPRPAAAESHKLLVMQSEGRADATTRAKIDAAIVKLARATEAQTAAGELTFSEAATAVGCKPETAACKDEVLGMLAVDEIVLTSVTPKPGGLEIVVHRVVKGGATRDAAMLLATGTPPDKLDGIVPLFTDKPAAAIPPVTRTEPTTPEPVLPSPTTIQQPPSPSVVMTETTDPLADRPSTGHHRLELAGMAGGSALVVVSFFLWGAARGVQSEIDTAPTTTRQDLAHLRDLESRGDTYANLGNLLAVSGLIVGSLSTYFYIKDHHGHRPGSTTPVARITPTVLDHGGGLVLTLGGTP